MAAAVAAAAAAAATATSKCACGRCGEPVCSALYAAACVRVCCVACRVCSRAGGAGGLPQGNHENEI